MPQWWTVPLESNHRSELESIEIHCRKVLFSPAGSASLESPCFQRQDTSGSFPAAKCRLPSLHVNFCTRPNLSLAGDMKRILATAAVLIFLWAPRALAQSAMPTIGALTRTFMIKVGDGTATMFAVHVDGKQYWITARHVLTGATTGPPFGELTNRVVTIEVNAPIGKETKWTAYQFDVIDPGDPNFDIVVLVARPPMPGFSTKSLAVLMEDSGGERLGGECSFLGYPYQESWTATMADNKLFRMPYIKHCYISAILPERREIALDGINNPGFSGGPVLYGTGPTQRVIGVISAYVTEDSWVRPVEVTVPDSLARPSAQRTHRETHPAVATNTGIIHACDIQVAVEAIRRHPIGRPETDSDTPGKN